MEIIACNSIFISPSKNVAKFITLFIFTLPFFMFVCRPDNTIGDVKVRTSVVMKYRNNGDVEMVKWICPLCIIGGSSYSVTSIRSFLCIVRSILLLLIVWWIVVIIYKSRYNRYIKSFYLLIFLSCLPFTM